MKIDRYVVFDDVELAEAFVSRLDQVRGSSDRWDDPTIHPTNDQAVIGWCDDYLAAYEWLLGGHQTLSPSLASAQGWQFHAYFKGRFVKVRMKLEEAQFLFDGLREMEQKANVPVLSSLFFAFTTALYAVSEVLKTTCCATADGKAWWINKIDALKQDRVLSSLHQINNAHKHKLSGSPLVVSTKICGARLPQFPGQIIISADGAYGITGAGTPRERRVLLPGLMMQTTVRVTAPDASDLGSVTSVCAEALSAYEDVVFEARQHFDR